MTICLLEKVEAIGMTVLEVRSSLAKNRHEGYFFQFIIARVRKCCSLSCLHTLPVVPTSRM